MGFFDLPPKTMTLLAVLFGYMMIDELSTQQQDALGNWLELVGQMLETSSAQAGLQQSLLSQQKNQEMERRLARIEELLNVQI